VEPKVNKEQRSTKRRKGREERGKGRRKKGRRNTCRAIKMQGYQRLNEYDFQMQITPAI